MTSNGCCSWNRRGCPHLKWRAPDYTQDDRCPAVVGRGLSHNFADRRHIVVLDSSAQGVSKQLLGNCFDKLVPFAQQYLTQFSWSLKFSSVGEFPRRINRNLA